MLIDKLVEEHSSEVEHLQEQICNCYCVSRAEIMAAIRNGNRRVETISEETYACQGCGGCRFQIEALLLEAEERP